MKLMAIDDEPHRAGVDRNLLVGLLAFQRRLERRCRGGQQSQAIFGRLSFAVSAAKIDVNPFHRNRRRARWREA